MTDVHVMQPFGGPIIGVPDVPGSKSQTNRALLCAALAEGTSRLSGILLADDTEAMLEAVISLGAEIEADHESTSMEVKGTGGDLRLQDIVIDCRSSGTTSRFLLPVIMAGKGNVVLDGSDQLRSRPFDEQIKALRSLGCSLTETRAPGKLPIEVVAEGVNGAKVEISGATSSQFVSGLMMAAPLYTGGLIIELTGTIVSRPYLDLTIKVMNDFGVVVEQPNESTYVIEQGPYRGADIEIEPDASAASYFFAAAAITQGKVKVDGLHRESCQGDIEFVDVLEKLGAKVTWGKNSIEVEGDQINGGTFDPVSYTPLTLPTIHHE